MINQQMLDYIKQQMLSGESRENISRALLENGWPQESIDEGFDSLNQFSNPETTSSQSPNISLKDQSFNSNFQTEASAGLNMEAQGQNDYSSSGNYNFEGKGKFFKSMMLVKASLKVVMMDKEIMLFPVFSSLASLVVLGIFAAGLFFTNGYKDGSVQHEVIYYSVLFLLYFVSYFIVIYFNAGLVTCAQIRFSGGDPTFKDGMRNANKHIGKIAAWALVAATVGVILKFVSDKSKWLGKVVVSLLGMAWSLFTYFIVPVLVFEDLGVLKSAKNSGQLFKQTWGENFISNFSMGAVFSLLGMLGMIPLIASIFMYTKIVLPALLIFIFYIMILSTISASLKGVFDVALYNYAKSGTVSSYFDEGMIRAAFVPKKKEKII